jgi:hypothetical protein
LKKIEVRLLTADQPLQFADARFGLRQFVGRLFIRRPGVGPRLRFNPAAPKAR